MPWRYFLFFLVAASPIYGDAATSFAKFKSSLTPECQERLSAVKEFPLLASIPEVAEALAAGKSRKAVDEAIEKWSSDLLLKLTLDLESEFLSKCGKATHVPSLVAALKTNYLK